MEVDERREGIPRARGRVEKLEGRHEQDEVARESESKVRGDIVPATKVPPSAASRGGVGSFGGVARIQQESYWKLVVKGRSSLNHLAIVSSPHWQLLERGQTRQPRGCIRPLGE